MADLAMPAAACSNPGDSDPDMTEPTDAARELLAQAATVYADNAPHRDYVNAQAAAEQARADAANQAGGAR